jgi:hypothetical protein
MWDYSQQEMQSEAEVTRRRVDAIVWSPTGQQTTIVKAKVRVHRLTLPPSSILTACRDEKHLDQERERKEERQILDKDKIARISELGGCLGKSPKTDSAWC